MIFFIFTLLLMFSLSTVLYLMVRALPRLEELPHAGAHGAAGSGTGAQNAAGSQNGAAAFEPRTLLDRWAHSELPEKFDAWFNDFLLKFLRKFKVIILRLDNTVSTRLRKIHREKTENGKKD